MQKCRYIKDEIAGDVLIPECWSVVISGDLDDCICGPEKKAPSQSNLVKNLRAKNQQLTDKINELNAEIKHLNDLLKKSAIFFKKD